METGRLCITMNRKELNKEPSSCDSILHCNSARKLFVWLQSLSYTGIISGLVPSLASLFPSQQQQPNGMFTLLWKNGFYIFLSIVVYVVCHTGSFWTSVVRRAGCPESSHLLNFDLCCADLLCAQPITVDHPLN